MYNMNPDLTQALASAYADLKSFSADEEGYTATMRHIATLHELQNAEYKLRLEATEQEHQHEQSARPFYKRVDPSTALTVAGNIFIGLAVIKYEQTGVIGTKVMSFMRKI